jgi:hypothetical protein
MKRLDKDKDGCRIFTKKTALGRLLRKLKASRLSLRHHQPTRAEMDW